MCRHLADIKDVIRGCKAGLPTHTGFRLRFGAAKLVHTWLPTRQWDTGENICDTQSNKRRKKTMGFPRNSVSECSRCTGAYWGLHRRASVSISFLPSHCRAQGPGPPQNTLPESHKSEHKNTHSTSMWLGGGAHNTGFDSERSETPKRFFSPLPRPLG